MPTSPAYLAKLESLAREATPGDWFTDRPEVDRFDHVTGHYTTPDRMHVISRVKPDGQEYAVVAITDGEQDEANAAYIAAANPAAVLALIERVRELEADAARLNWILSRVRYAQVSEETWRADVHWHSTGGDLCDRDAIDAAMKETTDG